MIQTPFTVPWHDSGYCAKKGVLLWLKLIQNRKTIVSWTQGNNSPNSNYLSLDLHLVSRYYLSHSLAPSPPPIIIICPHQQCLKTFTFTTSILRSGILTGTTDTSQWTSPPRSCPTSATTGRSGSTTTRLGHMSSSIQRICGSCRRDGQSGWEPMLLMSFLFWRWWCRLETYHNSNCRACGRLVVMGVEIERSSGRDVPAIY